MARQRSGVARQPPTAAIVFASTVSLIAQNIAAYRQTCADRRGTAGIWASDNGYQVHIEAFGPTPGAVDAQIDRYMRAWPAEEYRTQFAVDRDGDKLFCKRVDMTESERWKGPCAATSNFEKRETIKTEDGEIVCWLSAKNRRHAKMIAAAPDMLAALKVISDLLRRYVHSDEPVDLDVFEKKLFAIESAIAKAEPAP